MIHQLPPHDLTVVSESMVQLTPYVESFLDQGIQMVCPVDGFPMAVQVEKKLLFEGNHNHKKWIDSLEGEIVDISSVS
ncbi:hypothetical protein A2U01_0045414 [Trifolium medium]|uniref:Uncharacterized protein n=1 Tax=Trifolium medium TaxID=97028 RepID=A0A392QIL8_9FABA|nr:hypothetical protein [Trifolium medium]